MARGTIEIGAWRFEPAGGELVCGAERRRLEDRAARTLELLARRRGEVVTQAEIVDEVWEGRRQSPNSVAIVISDLRRALGDDARDPRHIETVTKRGYRLAASEGSEAVPARRRPPVWVWAVLAGAVAALGLATTGRFSPPPAPTARIEPATNATGDPRYAALAHAVDGLIATDLKALPGLTLLAPGATQEPDLVVTGQVILWTGHPAVALSAVDRARGVMIWSGMASGPEAAIPGQVAQELSRLSPVLARRTTR
jgi:DNA-binding winged helix-turn-helix (wHTH) protein